MNNLKKKLSGKAKIILILFGLFISLVIGELIVRGIEYYQYFKPEHRALFEAYNTIYSDERDKDYVFGHKQNINFTFEIEPHNFTFITNSDGLRETQNYQNLEKSIIYLGDSIVEGHTVDNNEAMDEVFERKTGITALNFGVGSSNTIHEFNWLKSKYKNIYNTKLIILGFCLNDFPQNRYLRYFNPSLGNMPRYKYLSDTESIEVKYQKTFWEKAKHVIRMSKLVQLVYANIKRMQTRNLPPFRFDQVNEENKYYTEQYINKIREFSKGIGSDFVVIIFPYENQLQYKYTTHKRMQDALIQILERNEISYIDLYDLLKRNQQTRPNIRLFFDNTHPNEEGHRLIGEYLAQELPKTFPRVFE